MKQNRYKTALVMEGGAMRGLFTCGVIDVLMEEGITFDGAAGISAGAAFGSNYKSHQNGRVLRYMKRFCNDPRFCSIRSLVTTGDLYGAEFCYRTIPYELDKVDCEAFEKDPMEFYAGAADVETGECIYHLCRDGREHDMDWIRASASMPLVSRIVELDGHRLLDGGIVDSIPYRFMKDKGYDRYLVILTQPADFRKSENRLLPLMKIVYRKYPRFVEAMRTRHIRYNQQVDEVRKDEKKGITMVICPDESLNIGKTEKDTAEIDRVYEIGRKLAYRKLDEIKKFLGE